MKKLVEYKYDELVSLCFDGNNLRKIVKLPLKNNEFMWSSVEIFRDIDKVDIYTNGFYVGTFILDEHMNFLHFVNKIVLKYCSSTKRYIAEIHLNPPKW